MYVYIMYLCFKYTVIGFVNKTRIFVFFFTKFLLTSNLYNLAQHNDNLFGKYPFLSIVFFLKLMGSTGLECLGKAIYFQFIIIIWTKKFININYGKFFLFV